MANVSPPLRRARSIWDSLSPEEFEQLQAYTKCKAFSLHFSYLFIISLWLECDSQMCFVVRPVHLSSNIKILFCLKPTVGLSSRLSESRVKIIVLTCGSANYCSLYLGCLSYERTIGRSLGIDGLNLKLVEQTVGFMNEGSNIQRNLLLFVLYKVVQNTALPESYCLPQSVDGSITLC